MSRDDGFAVADTDTGMLADPKILALARKLHDPIRTGAAIALYDAVRLASWKAGRRLTLEETVPAWWLDPIDDLAVDLVAVGLLDSEHRIPVHAWQGWFGPALERRLAATRSSIFGGLVRQGRSPEQANREADARIAEQRKRLLSVEAQPIGSALDLSVRPSVRPSNRPSVVATVEKDDERRSTHVEPAVTNGVSPGVTETIEDDDEWAAEAYSSTICRRCHRPGNESNPLIKDAVTGSHHRFDPCPIGATA